MSDDMYAKQGQEIDPKTGLPVFSEEVKAQLSKRGAVALIIFRVFCIAIGCGVAYPIYRYGDQDKYDERISLAKGAGQEWSLLGLIIFMLTVDHLNRYPMKFKEQFMGGRAGGNLRANQFMYKKATEADGEGSAIVLIQDGDIGRYNRGNRSLTHFIENSFPIIACLPLNFYLFPLPTFVLLCMYCLGRIFHQVGYANGGWGKHGLGFAISMFTSYFIMGLMIIAYIKMVF